MNRRGRIVTLVVLIGFAGLVLFPALQASAHTVVTRGEYVLTIGWKDEPAIAGVVNGLDLGVQRHFASNNTTFSVVGAETTLAARLFMGSIGVNKTIEPQFARPGWYTFDVIPTRPGTYKVRITGMLNTTTIDASVTLDDVSPASDISFPIADPTANDLQNQLTQANAQIAAVQSQLTIAIAFGVIGIIMALAAVAMSARILRGQRKTP